MFGKGKKEKKPKSKARKVVEWTLTGIFAALLVGIVVIQIVNRTSKNQNVFGPQYQKVLTDSMSPVYKVNDIIVIEKTNPQDIYRRVNEKHQDVDLSFYWDVYGTKRSMTHRLISVTYYEEVQFEAGSDYGFHYTFVAHGINKKSEFCKLSDGTYGDCTTQTQTFHEDAIIGRVTRKSHFMTFATSIWGLLIFLLVPCMYLIITSVLDIFKAVKDDDEAPATTNGEVVGEASDKPKDPLAGLSEKEKEKLKKQMLDEMLGKKK